MNSQRLLELSAAAPIPFGPVGFLLRSGAVRSGPPVRLKFRVVAIDGRLVTTNRDVYDYVARQPVGRPIGYTLVKDGTTFTRVVRTMCFTTAHYWLGVGLFVAFGRLSVGAGVAVALLQPRILAARAFLSQGFLAGSDARTSPYWPSISSSSTAGRSAAGATSITPDAMDALTRLEFSGNVRGPIT